jgi:hypothetical protein
VGRFVVRPRLEQLFADNAGPLIHKWPHYFPIYETHLRRFQGQGPTLLEIGVSHGGSLHMWRDYLGRGATIIGLDKDPRAATLDGEAGHVRVGDQGDDDFLRSVSVEFGPFDIVIDDGSHRPAHQISSLLTLWSSVTDGGVYIVEDLHTNYWPEYEGGPGMETFMDLAKAMIDNINATHSRSEDLQPSRWTREVTGMHVYDSVVVLDKGDNTVRPAIMTGHPRWVDAYGNEVEITPEHRAQLESTSRPLQRARRALRSILG